MVAIIILIIAIYLCNAGNRFHFHIPSSYFLCKTWKKNARVPTSSQQGVSHVLNVYKRFIKSAMCIQDQAFMLLNSLILISVFNGGEH